jgi:hypothetical protein
MERVIWDIARPVSEQGHMVGVKRRDFICSTSRPALTKRGKSGQSSRLFQRRGSFLVGGEFRGSRKISCGGSSRGLT